MEDKFIMPWGKYKGEYLCDLPNGYLEWVETNVEDQKIVTLAIAELDYRERNDKYVGGDSN
jgi:uncharacterized protein (DUF3820 family)